MAAADTREAMEFSVGLRKDGEPALGNWGGADTRLPPPTADFGDVPGVVAFLRDLPFSVGPSGPVQDPAVIGNFLVLCLFFIEFNERLLRSACLFGVFGSVKS